MTFAITFGVDLGHCLVTLGVMFGTLLVSNFGSFWGGGEGGTKRVPFYIQSGNWKLENKQFGMICSSEVSWPWAPAPKLVSCRTRSAYTVRPVTRRTTSRVGRGRSQIAQT